MAARITRRLPGAWRDADIDGRDAGELPGFFPFLPQESEGEVDALDFAEPTFSFGPGPAGQFVCGSCGETSAPRDLWEFCGLPRVLICRRCTCREPMIVVPERSRRTRPLVLRRTTCPATPTRAFTMTAVGSTPRRGGLGARRGGIGTAHQPAARPAEPRHPPATGAGAPGLAEG